MPRCACPLTPCRVKVQSGQALCRFCETHCARELARRLHRRRMLKVILATAAIVCVAWFAGWAFHMYRAGTHLGNPN